MPVGSVAVKERHQPLVLVDTAGLSEEEWLAYFTITSAVALKQATAPSAGRRCPFPGIPTTTKKGAAPAAGIP